MNRIGSDVNAQKEYDRIRQETLSQALPLVYEGKDIQAIRMFFDMQFALCKKYGITADPDLIVLLQKDQRYSLNMEGTDSLLGIEKMPNKKS